MSAGAVRAVPPTCSPTGATWSRRVGPVILRHRVEPAGDGDVAAVDLSAPGLLEPALRATYGPLIALLPRNLARVAERP